MLVCPDMRCQPALTDDACSWPLRPVGVDQVDLAVGFIVLAALLAVSTRVDLRAYSDPLAFFDESDLGTDSNSVTHDLWFCS